jgi:hypothetical protein
MTALHLRSSGNRKLKAVGLRYFALAIRLQNKERERFLDTLKISQERQDQLLYLLLNTVLLFGFEIMCPSGSHSWISHVRGACRLLEIAGAEMC